MQKYQDMIRLFECAINKYIQLEKKPHSYGYGIELTQTEIHTISAIGDNPNINVTSLAKL